MKILCVADSIDPLVYSSLIKQRFADIDLVLGAGDLPLEYYSYIVSCLNRPLLFVFGNHNLKKYQWFKKRKDRTSLEGFREEVNLINTFGARFIGDKVVRVNGLILAGLGGSKRYNNGENQYTEFQMFWKILRLVPALLWHRLVHGRYLDVFLTHAPPREIHDKEDLCHQGFKVFRWFLKRFKPQYMVHGHIHLYNLNEIRRTRFQKTLVVNAYDHLVIEVEAQ